MIRKTCATVHFSNFAIAVMELAVCLASFCPLCTANMHAQLHTNDEDIELGMRFPHGSCAVSTQVRLLWIIEWHYAHACPSQTTHVKPNNGHIKLSNLGTGLPGYRQPCQTSVSLSAVVVDRAILNVLKSKHHSSCFWEDDRYLGESVCCLTRSDDWLIITDTSKFRNNALNQHAERY